ncbi:MAG: hypothetical protein GY856_05570 [bacterium]|nr:hypothetical protein [bacterium]
MRNQNTLGTPWRWSWIRWPPVYKAVLRSAGRRSHADRGSATGSTAVAVDDDLATAGSFTLRVIQPVVEKADAFLEIFPSVRDPRGSDQQSANAIKDDFDDYNDGRCD